MFDKEFEGRTEFCVGEVSSVFVENVKPGS